MKEKILRMLEELYVFHQEYEKVELNKGYTLTDVIEIWAYSPQLDGVKKDKKAFVVNSSDDIFIYSGSGKLLSLIDKKGPEYIVLAKLANYLGRMRY